jgi:nicotinamidase-related amidase
MEAPSDDLHGSAPDTSPVALLIIDLINDLEFPGSEPFVKPTLALGKRVAMLKKAARAQRVPVIYVNDNFGKWRSDLRQLVAHCLRDGVRGKPLVEALRPGPDDYFVLKPKHSSFFATTLGTLLEYLGTKTLILTGISADACIQFTAADAYMRDFRLVIPEDCVASGAAAHTRQALRYFRRVLHADTRPAAQLDLAELVRADYAGISA